MELRCEGNRRVKQISVENYVRLLISSVRQQLVGAAVERELIDQSRTSMGFAGRFVAMVEQSSCRQSPENQQFTAN